MDRGNSASGCGGWSNCVDIGSVSDCDEIGGNQHFSEHTQLGCPQCHGQFGPCGQCGKCQWQSGQSQSDQYQPLAGWSQKTHTLGQHQDLHERVNKCLIRKVRFSPGRPRCQSSQCQQDQSQLGRHQPTPGHASQEQFQSGQCQQFELGQIRLAAQLGSNPPSQQARPETKSGESMLEATRSCSLAGLCFCLLAISAATLTSFTIFCCTFLPLLLLGCSLSARFLFPSQTKPVAGKQ